MLKDRFFTRPTQRAGRVFYQAVFSLRLEAPPTEQSTHRPFACCGLAWQPI